MRDCVFYVKSQSLPGVKYSEKGFLNLERGNLRPFQYVEQRKVLVIELENPLI